MYTFPVRFEWDEAERKANIAKHGIDFVDVPEMFTSLMLVGTDDRKDYGETRNIGRIHSRAAHGGSLYRTSAKLDSHYLSTKGEQT